MSIKSSSISNSTHESGEPIQKLKMKLSEAELSRLNGEPTFTVEEARERLAEKYNNKID